MWVLAVTESPRLLHRERGGVGRALKTLDGWRLFTFSDPGSVRHKESAGSAAATTRAGAYSRGPRRAALECPGQVSTDDHVVAGCLAKGFAREQTSRSQ